MEVTILFFGPQRDSAGTPNAVVELASGATLGSLRAALLEAIPEISHFAQSGRFALNGEIADDTTPLTSGDEVAIISLVSGG